MNACPRLLDYVDHIQQAAADACGFVQGMGKEARFFRTSAPSRPSSWAKP